MSSLATAPAPEVTIRELPAAEWERLRLGVPILAGELPDPNKTAVMVIEEAGEIVGWWFVFYAIHVEPMLIPPHLRKNPSVIRQLWGGVLNILDRAQANLAFAVIEDKDLPNGNADYAGRLGFQKLAGSLYFVRREDAVDTRKRS